MIIGLTGLKGSGKDTVAAYLIKEHGFERRSFADPLKRSFAAFFDIPMSEIENLKNYLDTRVILGEFVNGDSSGITYSDMSVRQALQRYGTESHRDVFGQDFWVDRALPVGAFYSGRAIVVSDCRFQNEADRITELGGFVVRVERPISGEDQDLHSSELGQASIVPHYRLQNDTTLAQLEHNINEMLDNLSESQ